MTINDIENKTKYNDNITENINSNSVNLNCNKDENRINENEQNDNNIDISKPSVYYHLADETDDSSNDTSSLFSSTYSSSDDSNYDNSDYSSESDEYSCYDDENDIHVLDIIKSALNKLKLNIINNNKNENGHSLQNNKDSINKLCEIDIQLKELSYEVKDLILLLNKDNFIKEEPI